MNSMPSQTTNLWTWGQIQVRPEGNRVSARTAVAWATIIRQPSFKSESYESYRKSMDWWVFPHAGISQGRLLDAVWLNENGPAKGASGDYFHSTKQDPENPPVEGF